MRTGKFKKLKNFESLYFINEQGIILNKKLKQRKFNKRKDGYSMYTLCKNGKLKSFLTHRLVYENFKGEILDGYEINHIDGNKLNNDISNLELVTRKQNIRHRFDVLKKGNSSGSKNGKSKKVINIITGQIFDTVIEASKSYNIIRQTLSKYLNGVRTNKTNLRFYE